MPSAAVYDSRSVANYLIGKSLPAGLTALQVLKLSYIAHGFVLALLGRPLLRDDVEAWKFGPVVRRIYSALPFGAAPNTNPIAGVDPAPLQNDERGIVDGVFSQYGKFDGIYLSTLTHRPGSPWDRTWKTYGQNAVIPQSLIREHYETIVKNWRAAGAAGKAYNPDVL
jgi:uncharacterized phage-associated protein